MFKLIKPSKNMIALVLSLVAVLSILLTAPGFALNGAGNKGINLSRVLF